MAPDKLPVSSASGVPQLVRVEQLPGHKTGKKRPGFATLVPSGGSRYERIRDQGPVLLFGLRKAQQIHNGYGVAECSGIHSVHPALPRQCHWRKPELALAVTCFDMDMGRLRSFIGIKVETKPHDSQDRWLATSIGSACISAVHAQRQGVLGHRRPGFYRPLPWRTYRRGS